MRHTAPLVIQNQLANTCFQKQYSRSVFAQLSNAFWKFNISYYFKFFPFSIARTGLIDPKTTTPKTARSMSSTFQKKLRLGNSATLGRGDHGICTEQATPPCSGPAMNSELYYLANGDLCTS